MCHRRWNIEKAQFFCRSISFDPFPQFSLKGASQSLLNRKDKHGRGRKGTSIHWRRLKKTQQQSYYHRRSSSTQSGLSPNAMQLNRNQEQTAICKRPRWRHSVRQCQCSSACIRGNLRGVSCCHDWCMRVAPSTLLLSQPTSSSFWLSFENCTKGSQLRYLFHFCHNHLLCAHCLIFTPNWNKAIRV